MGSSLCGFQWAMICADFDGKLYVWVAWRHIFWIYMRGSLSGFLLELLGEDLYGSYMRGFVWKIMCGSLWKIICEDLDGQLSLWASMADPVCGFP